MTIDRVPNNLAELEVNPPWELKSSLSGEFCPHCFSPWHGNIFCPNDGTLREKNVIVGERYALKEPLRAAEMGYFFEAHHKHLGKNVIVKLLLPEFVKHPKIAQLFLSEAEIWSQLRHDHIVPIIDFGRDSNGIFFLVLSHFSGPSILESLPTLSNQVALQALRQLCRALETVHKKGAMHLCLYPWNIVLKDHAIRGPVVKLFDFGLPLENETRPDTTLSDKMRIRLAYQAPEQIQGLANLDHRADLYSLGVLAFHMLTKGLPFKGQSQDVILKEKLIDPAGLVRARLAKTRRAIVQVIIECLAPEPLHRPGSAGEMEQRLITSSEIISGTSENLTNVRAGSYRIVKLLGFGGIGSVWLAEHPVIGAKVAIKVLHDQMCQNEEAVQRFVLEAQAVNRIDSPHIVKTFDFGKLPDGRDYAVMELLEGETLADRQLRCSQFSWKQVRPILLQLCHALVKAHAAGIVHRDLKPENIHLGNDEENPNVKILDFGIAKLLSSKNANIRYTRQGVCIGTPLYAAPEQMTGHDVDEMADIYALGVVLYELLVGKPPFSGEIQEIISTKLVNNVPPIVEVLPAETGLPPLIASLIDQMLLKDKEDRPSIEVVLKTLESTPNQPLQLLHHLTQLKPPALHSCLTPTLHDPASHTLHPSPSGNNSFSTADTLLSIKPQKVLRDSNSQANFDPTPQFFAKSQRKKYQRLGMTITGCLALLLLGFLFLWPASKSRPSLSLSINPEPPAKFLKSAQGNRARSTRDNRAPFTKDNRAPSSREEDLQTEEELHLDTLLKMLPQPKPKMQEGLKAYKPRQTQRKFQHHPTAGDNAGLLAQNTPSNNAPLAEPGIDAKANLSLTLRTIKIITRPPRAKIRFHDQIIGKTPFGFIFPKGDDDQFVILYKAGYFPARLVLRADHKKTIVVTLQKKTSRPPNQEKINQPAEIPPNPEKPKLLVNPFED